MRSATGLAAARRRSRRSYGPPPTSSSLASGTLATTSGQAWMRRSCPLRGTSRETHTHTGADPSPWRARTSPPSTAGW
jgi:hypothetical protein